MVDRKVYVVEASPDPRGGYIDGGDMNRRTTNLPVTGHDPRHAEEWTGFFRMEKYKNTRLL